MIDEKVEDCVLEFANEERRKKERYFYTFGRGKNRKDISCHM